MLFMRVTRVAADTGDPMAVAPAPAAAVPIVVRKRLRVEAMGVHTFHKIKVAKVSYCQSVGLNGRSLCYRS